MEEKLAARLERAGELLRTVRHAAIATVNANGSPHNTPVFVGFDVDLTMYWSSSPEAVHSQNIVRTGQVFIVLFDTMERGGGLYLECTSQQVEASELPGAVAAFNRARARCERPAVPIGLLQGAAQQRLYRAVPARAWVNWSERDEAGYVVRDIRREIKLADLRSVFSPVPPSV